MKRFKKYLALLCVGTLSLGLLTACKDKEATSVDSTNTAFMEDPEDISLMKDGMIISDLSGEWIDEKYKDQRPLCVMINNIQEAMPQSGISNAPVVYEMLVEGGITRLLAVFDDYQDLGKTGPIRSSRHYYVYTALEYDAIYAHIGQSVVAEQVIKDTNIDNLNGMEGVGNIMVYRDNTRVAPHNAYSDGERFVNSIEYAKYDTTHKDNFEKKFSFYSKNTDLKDGKTASTIHTNYSNGRKPYFEYDEANGVYLRNQYGGPQIDDQTNETLSYKNVIIQFAHHEPLLDELIDIDLSTNGEGYYATNGKYIPITWKCEDDGVVRYYTKDGEKLKMNPGKTWITIFPDSQQGDVIFE